MNNSEGESPEHKNLVKRMVEHYQSEGYTKFRADLDGHTQPDSINGKIPDVIAWGHPSKPPAILEVETCDSIDNNHTESQFKAFSVEAKQNGWEFHVTIPKICYDNAKKVIDALSLSPYPKIWTVS